MQVAGPAGHEIGKYVGGAAGAAALAKKGKKGRAAAGGALGTVVPTGMGLGSGVGAALAASHELEGDQLDETPKLDQKLRKDARPLKPGGLYKTGRTKEQMGDKAVIARRNLRNAIDRNAAEGGVGSKTPAKETAERREKHKAARGVKTKRYG